jgi:DNA-binding response OmpR family regulator
MPASSNAWKEHAILIVDDEPQILAELQTVLELKGFAVTTRLSAEEGLRCMEEAPAPLVIADQKMPAMSGTDFLTLVKARYPDTVTIILSAFAEPAYLMAAVNQANVHRYLLKPWDQEELLACVGEALRLHRERLAFHAMDDMRYWSKQMWRENFAFLGELSGELYNQLFPVLEASYLMESQQRGFGGSAGLPMSMFVDRQEMTHAAVVVGKLGQFYSQYRSRAAFQRQPVAAWVRRCVARARAAAEAAGIAVACREDYAEDLPELWIEPRSFTQALAALLENALLFNERTAARGLWISVYRALDAIRIEIRDDGPGLDDAKRPFLPLYSTCPRQSTHTIDNHSEDAYNFSQLNHAGLGLTMARWGITQHDGILELANPGEAGALFRIEIPLEQALMGH